MNIYIITDKREPELEEAVKPYGWTLIWKEEKEYLRNIGWEDSVTLVQGSTVPKKTRQIRRDAIKEKTAELFREYQNTIDAVIFLTSYWENGPQGLLGRHYGGEFDGYQVGMVRRKGSIATTLIHEIMHMADDICYAYGGVYLEAVFGVGDFDHYVVHAHDPRFTYNDYLAPYKTLQPYLLRALIARKKVGLAIFDLQKITRMAKKTSSYAQRQNGRGRNPRRTRRPYPA